MCGSILPSWQQANSPIDDRTYNSPEEIVSKLLHHALISRNNPKKQYHHFDDHPNNACLIAGFCACHDGTINILDDPFSKGLVRNSKTTNGIP